MSASRALSGLHKALKEMFTICRSRLPVSDVLKSHVERRSNQIEAELALGSLHGVGPRPDIEDDGPLEPREQEVNTSARRLQSRSKSPRPSLYVVFPTPDNRLY